MAKLNIVGEAQNCKVIKVPSPVGTIFVSCIEDKTKELARVHIFVGKTGAELAAWADSMGRLITLSLEHGADIPEIVEELSGTTSDRVAWLADKVPVRSGPEAIAVALLRYQQAIAADIMKVNKGPFNYGLR